MSDHIADRSMTITLVSFLLFIIFTTSFKWSVSLLNHRISATPRQPSRNYDHRSNLYRYRTGSVIAAVSMSDVIDSKASIQILLFGPHCLRIHDNPGLRYIQSKLQLDGSSSASRIAPVYVHDPAFLDEFSHESQYIVDYESYVSSSLEGVRLQLHSMGVSLAEFSGSTSDILANIIGQIKSHQASDELKIDVIYCESDVEPYFSGIKSVLARLPPSSCSLIGVKDDLIPSMINPRQSGNDLFTSYEGDYRNPDLIPRPVMQFDGSLFQLIDVRDKLSPDFIAISGAAASKNSVYTSASGNLIGEREAINLVQRYIEVGDKQFSDEFFDTYTQKFNYSQAAFGRSLPRLKSFDVDIDQRKSSLFEGEVFNALMGPWLKVGGISPRLLYHARSELASSKGSLEVSGRPSILSMLSFWKPRFESKSSDCLMRTKTIRRDWHKQLAMINNIKALTPSTSITPLKVTRQVKFRYWNSFLQRELLAFESNQFNPSKPIFFFVHGFGGSLDQFSELSVLLSHHFNCVAIDSLGFGYSEKPTLSYNQYLWTDQIYDAIQSLQKRWRCPIKVVVAGNSIGGFTAAAVAAKLSASSESVSCAGLVLMNSAGRILGGEEDVTIEESDSGLLPQYQGPSPQFLQLFGRVIFKLLQPNIERLCEWLYPSNPSKVKLGLATSIFRDSCDIGASDVIASGGKLPRPISMNYLFEKYSGPVLIAQGILDPLNNATERAIQFGNIRNGRDIDVRQLSLGHCPMDENPALVADSILDWARSRNIV